MRPAESARLHSHLTLTPRTPVQRSLSAHLLLNVERLLHPPSELGYPQSSGLNFLRWLGLPSCSVRGSYLKIALTIVLEDENEDRHRDGRTILGSGRGR